MATLTFEVLCHLQLVEDPVGLPPPVMLCLREFRFTKVTIEIGPVLVGAIELAQSEMKDQQEGSHQ